MQFVIASFMVGLTVVMHLAGLALLVALIRRLHRRVRAARARVHQLVIIFGAAFGLFALHTPEIWAYPAPYIHLGAFPTFNGALYFLTTTYLTVGFGDVVLPRTWRLVGTIEGANGIILLGWSTAFCVSMIDRIRLFEHGMSSDD